MATTATLTARVESEGIDSATNELRRLENQADRTETATEQLESGSEQLIRALGRQSETTNATTRSMRGLGSATSNLLNFIPSLSTALTIAAAGVVALLTNIGSLRSELVRLADLSNTSVQEFQVLSSAFKTLNIDMDKTADILKDVNDKVGDFVLTGGGEFKTIFEKVIKPLGKTREELTKLGPGGILLLVAEGLEKIGANGQETTFILEALANDATLLVPLLKDNGQALKDISLAIEEKGLLLTENEVDALRRANKELSEMEVLVTNIFTKAKGFLAAAFFPEKNVENVEELIQTILTLDAAAIRSEQLGGLLGKNKAARLRIEAVKARARLEAIIFAGIQEDKIETERERKSVERIAIGDKRRANELEAVRQAEREKTIVKIEAEEQKLQAAIARDENERVRVELKAEQELTLERESAQVRLDLILSLNDTERDAIGRKRAERLTDLQKDLQKQLISHRDFQIAKSEINRNAEVAFAKLDEEAAKVKEQETEKLIGKITGLMQSGNKELFRIGQAAALANAVVETASAVSKALASAAPPLSFLLAAAAGIAGAAQVATIASASPPAERQQGGQFQAGQQLLVGEQGPELVEFGAGGRIASAQQTNRIAEGKAIVPEIIIINQTSENIAEPDVNIDEEQKIIILIRNTVSSDLENPNSRVSKSLSRSTTTARQF